MYNPNSTYRVRLFTASFEKHLLTENIETVISHRLKSAATLRQLYFLPEAYRLFHYEGDGLPGLAIDILGEYAVVYSSAAWVEVYREFYEGSYRTS